MARNRRNRALLMAAGMLMLVAQSAFAGSACPCGMVEASGGCHGPTPVEPSCHQEAQPRSCCADPVEAVPGCSAAVEASCCATADVAASEPVALPATSPETLAGPVELAPVAAPAEPAVHLAQAPASRAPAPPGAPAWLRHGALLN